MRLINTEVEGLFIIENFTSYDNRGSFIKTFNKDFFKENNLCINFEESYYSISNKNVIRGMHFQLPPYDHEKLVYVAKGEVLDVVLDIRKESKTYGKSISIILNDRNNKSFYIPKGLAHGFKTLEDNTIMVYNVSAVYNNLLDSGIHYNSFNFNWEIKRPIISDRDNTLTTFDKFDKINPF